MVLTFKGSKFSIYLLLICCLKAYTVKGMEQSMVRIEKKVEDNISLFEELSLDTAAYIINLLIDEEDKEKAIENIKSLGLVSKGMNKLVYCPEVLVLILRRISARRDTTLIDVVMILKKIGSSWLKEHANLKEKEIIDKYLLEAAEAGENTLTHFLLNSGAHVNTANNSGCYTALHCAIKGGHKDIVELLLNSGADINARDVNGHTPLHWAALFDRLEIVKVLLQFGANVNQQDNEGNTPLLEAIKEECIEVVELLVKFGADVNKENKLGWNSLHQANRRLKAIAKLLLQNGADFNKVDTRGHTPVSWATACSDDELVQLLLEHGGTR